jgi:hypothetical protein
MDRWGASCRIGLAGSGTSLQPFGGPGIGGRLPSSATINTLGDGVTFLRQYTPRLHSKLHASLHLVHVSLTITFSPTRQILRSFSAFTIGLRLHLLNLQIHLTGYAILAIVSFGIMREPVHRNI